jgi:hypothetical protein
MNQKQAKRLRRLERSVGLNREVMTGLRVLANDATSASKGRLTKMVQAAIENRPTDNVINLIEHANAIGAEKEAHVSYAVEKTIAADLETVNAEREEDGFAPITRAQLVGDEFMPIDPSRRQTPRALRIGAGVVLALVFLALVATLVAWMVR